MQFKWVFVILFKTRGKLSDIDLVINTNKNGPYVQGVPGELSL